VGTNTAAEPGFEIGANRLFVENTEPAVLFEHVKGARHLLLLREKWPGEALSKQKYEGLERANPPEYYRWFPSWIKEGNIF